jgi:hypothetical protein
MGSARRESVFHIVHGWRAATEAAATLIPGFIRPAVQAIPPGIARQLGCCRLSIVDELERPEVASRWTLTDTRLDISLAISGWDDHEIALELLVCLGQALWERVTDSQRRAYWLLLDDEISSGVKIAERSTRRRSNKRACSCLTARALRVAGAWRSTGLPLSPAQPPNTSIASGTT